MIKLENSTKQVEITTSKQCPFCIDNECNHPIMVNKKPWVLKCNATYREFQHRKNPNYPLFPEECPLDDSAFCAYYEYCDTYCPHHGECDEETSDKCHLFQFIELWYGAHRIQEAAK